MPQLNDRSRHCMTAIVFDTLVYAERLEEAGFTRDQAHGQARALRELFTDQIATSQDIAVLDASFSARIEKTEADLTRKIEKTEADLTMRIDQVRTDLTMMMVETKTELIKWHIGSVLAMAALIVGLAKFGS